MKYGLLADIHAHEHQDFAKMVLHNGIYINSRLKDILDTLWYCFETGNEKGVKVWLILGDVFHTRGQVPTVVRNTMWDLLNKAHDEFGCQFRILVGNHDQADRDGKVHSIHEWHNEWIQVVAETLEEDNFWYIPYMADHEDLVHCLTRMDIEEENPILCMHAGVDGAAVGTLEYRIKDPLTVEDLHAERFAWVFLGHYHKPQTIADNVVYVGSPCQLTRAEAGDKKRFLIYDTKSGKVSSVRTRCKEFYTVTWPECREDSLVDGYYDVVVEDGSSPEDIRLFFGEKGITSVKIIAMPKADNSLARIEVDETTTDDSLVEQYCEHKGAPKGAAELGLSLLSNAMGAVASNLRVKFLEVRAKNFFSLGDCTLRLNQAGSVIAVLGSNLDAEGFKSNGSGKSSLLPESLFWCLFGETARNVPADKVVSNIKKRNTFVRLTLMIDKQVVVVTRTRKHKDYGSGLFVSVDNVDMTQGTTAMTQTYLEQMLGMDYTTFSSVVAFSPETLRFVNSKDSEQKAVLDSILQTQRFGKALLTTKVRSKELADAYNATSIALREASVSLKSMQDNLATLIADIKVEEKYERDAAAQEQAEVNSLEQESKRLSSEIKVLKAKLADYPVVTTIDSKAASADYLKVVELAAGLAVSISHNRKEVNSIQVELDKLSAREGKPCPTCGQVVNNLAKMKVNLSTQRATKIQEGEALEKRLADANQSKTALKAKLDELDAQIEKNAELERGRAELGRQLTQAQQKLAEVDNNLITRPVYDNRRLYTLKERQDKLKKAIKALLGTITEGETDLEELATNKQVLDFWVEGFGNKGLKSFLLDNIIPHLTQYAQLFIDRLTGNSIAIKFSTVSDTGNDKFGVSAFNQEGADVYSGNSSGEKRRIDLAVMLALFMLANTRVKLNIMLLDEVLDTLDAAGIDIVVEILEEMAKKRKLTIFVTSHTELADRLHESITVVKRNGVSELKG